MQTRELYKTLVYNFSHGCRYSYNAYLETLKTTVSTFTVHTHVTRFNTSSPNWYLLENSQHNPKWSEKSHTQTSKCERTKQSAVYMCCLYVHTFSLSQISSLLGCAAVSLGGQFAALWSIMVLSEHQELLAPWHSITSQRTWILHTQHYLK